MSDIKQPETPPVKGGYLETTLPDGTVEKSSKRLWGSILLSAGGLLLLAVGVAAIFIGIKDPSTSLTAGTTLAGLGAGLLGIGVLDGVGRAIGGGK